MKILYTVFILLFILGKAYGQETTVGLGSSIDKGIFGIDLFRHRYFAEEFSAPSGPWEPDGIQQNSWTFTSHRYLGYTTLVGATANVVLGVITWNQYKTRGKPSSGLRTTHRALGYTTVGLSVATSTLGFINFWKLRNKKIGKTRRIVHMTLSTLATIGFITTASIAYNSRKTLESGSGTKTFFELYSNHRTVALISAGSVLLTIGVVIW